MAKLISKKRKSQVVEAEELRGLWEKALHWTQQRPKEVAAVAGGCTLLLLLLLASTFLTGKAEERRVASISAAIRDYTEAEGAVAEEASARLRTLADRYRRHEEGGQARYFLAGSLAAQGDYQGAADAYAKVAEDFSDNKSFSSYATLGLGYTYRLMGENEKALQVLESLLTTAGTPLPRSQIHMEMGRVYEALGKKEEALKTYRNLVETFPESVVSEEAQEKIAALEGA